MAKLDTGENSDL